MCKPKIHLTKEKVSNKSGQVQSDRSFMSRINYIWQRNKIPLIKLFKASTTKKKKNIVKVNLRVNWTSKRTFSVKFSFYKNNRTKECV